MENATRKIPRVAVLLAAYNGAPWIREQIATIVSQIHVNVTVFVSVDPSIDETEAIVREIMSTDGRVHMHNIAVRSGGAAQNFFSLMLSLDVRSFEYIAFADQDDIWFPGKVSEAIGAMLSRGSAGYSANVLAIWSGGRAKLVDKSHEMRKWDYFFEGGGPGCTFVLRKDLFEEFVIQLSEQREIAKKALWHDWLVYAFARSRGHAWFIDSVPRMIYRQHPRNDTGANVGFLQKLIRLKRVMRLGLSQSGIVASFCGRSESEFVKAWIDQRPSSFLFLAFRSNQCRRRKRDRIIFFFCCILLFSHRLVMPVRGH